MTNEVPKEFDLDDPSEVREDRKRISRRIEGIREDIVLAERIKKDVEGDSSSGLSLSSLKEDIRSNERDFISSIKEGNVSEDSIERMKEESKAVERLGIHVIAGIMLLNESSSKLERIEGYIESKGQEDEFDLNYRAKKKKIEDVRRDLNSELEDLKRDTEELYKESSEGAQRLQGSKSEVLERICDINQNIFSAIEDIENGEMPDAEITEKALQEAEKYEKEVEQNVKEKNSKSLSGRDRWRG